MPNRKRGVRAEKPLVSVKPLAIEAQHGIQAALLDSVTDMVVTTDTTGRVTLMNLAMRDFVGEPGVFVPAKKWAQVLRSEHLDGTAMSLTESPISRALREEPVRGIEHFVISKTGARRVVIANGQAIHDESGQLTGAMVALCDMTKQREAEAGIAFGTLHDPLTGLPNRTLFLDRVKRALQRARRQRWSTALLALNIDNLLAINVRLGYYAGDQLLAEVARRLRGAVRPYDSVSRSLDTVARLSGNEFFVLCEHVADERIANEIGERIAAALSPTVALGAETVQISACMGTTLTNDPSHDPDSLIAEAETALRRAQHRGPGTHELFAEEMRAQQRERIEGEVALRRALERGEFEVVYQPKVSLAIERLVGVEALLRWQHPEKGTVPPLQFIPLAESTGLIVPIGAWVFEQACVQAVRWAEISRDGTGLAVSVNVSGRQFESGLAELFKEIVSRTGVDPDTICLEVTESTVMSDPEVAITTLRELKSLGLGVSIDDFGTGYSSLAYLRRFNLDEIKVDKSFIDGLGRDPEATAIVAAVMGMAHALGLSVVAEGVETEQQLSALRGLGCDEAQGYFYARPQPAGDIGALINKQLGGSPTATTRGATSKKGLGSGTVIVVDDAADVRQLARFSLAAAGFDVLEADSGELAIELTHRVRPDCLVLDVNMPGLSGLEVCRAVRLDPATSATTIVMLTADTQASEKVEAFSLDADDYIVKPFAPRDLVSRVASAMRRRRESLDQGRETLGQAEADKALR